MLIAARHPFWLLQTIDYGPFGYLERFDPDYTPNTTGGPHGCCLPSTSQWKQLYLFHLFNLWIAAAAALLVDRKGFGHSSSSVVGLACCAAHPVCFQTLCPHATHTLFVSTTTTQLR